MARKAGTPSTTTPTVRKRTGNPNPQRPPAAVDPQTAIAGPASQPVKIAPNEDAIMPTNKPYPDMPVVPDATPLLQSMGATGTAIFSGVITSEEYNPDFHWKDGISIFEQMRRNDAQINAVLLMAELPIRRCTWSIEPASEDPLDIEIASFVETCLFHDMNYETSNGQTRYQSWDWTLQHILMMLQYGFSTFEICWKIEDGWVKWARWIPLLPRTIWRWWVGDDNELVGVQQWTFKDYTYQFVNIPADKVMHFAYRQEGNNFEGISLLRSAYKHWYYKQNFEKIDAIGIERNAVVPPVIQLPEQFTANDIQLAQQIVQNVRANELMGVTIPPGWDFSYPKNQQHYAASALTSMQYHDIMIARNFLAQFINLGSTETGAYNLNSSQLLTFYIALQAVVEYVEDIINSQAIRRLVDYNYDGVAKYPRLKASKIVAQDVNTISEALQKLANGVNPILHASPALEEYVCELLGIPKPAVNPVTATNPTDPNTPERPENDNANQHDDQESQDVPGVEPTQSPASPAGQAHEFAAAAQMMTDALAGLDAVARGVRWRK